MMYKKVITDQMFKRSFKEDFFVVCSVQILLLWSCLCAFSKIKKVEKAKQKMCHIFRTKTKSHSFSEDVYFDCINHNTSHNCGVLTK